MRHRARLALAGALLISAPGSAFAMGVPIAGTHGRAEIKTTCGSNGGSYYSNLDSYGCVKSNCNGKGAECEVICNNDGKCNGSVPGRKSIKKITGGIDGVLTPKTR